MAGFSPVGSIPVAAVPAGVGVNYLPQAGSILFTGTTALVTMLVPPIRVTTFAAEVLNTGNAAARVTTFAAEVLRSAASGSTFARVTTFAAEVLRSIRNAGSDAGFVYIT